MDSNKEEVSAIYFIFSLFDLLLCMQRNRNDPLTSLTCNRVGDYPRGREKCEQPTQSIDCSRHRLDMTRCFDGIYIIPSVCLSYSDSTHGPPEGWFKHLNDCSKERYVHPENLPKIRQLAKAAYGQVIHQQLWMHCFGVAKHTEQGKGLISIHGARKLTLLRYHACKGSFPTA